VNDQSATSPSVTVEECFEVSDELVDAMVRLVPQLSSSAPPMTAEIISGVVSMTLVVFPIPTGVRAWIEDVVVDEAARGQGVGEALNRRALELADELGARTVDLTSRPSREAANRLYRRIGFVQRETNVYRYERKD